MGRERLGAAGARATARGVFCMGHELNAGSPAAILGVGCSKGGPAPGGNEGWLEGRGGSIERLIGDRAVGEEV